jgi:DNA recombination protein RmuC
MAMQLPASFSDIPCLLAVAIAIGAVAACLVGALARRRLAADLAALREEKARLAAELGAKAALLEEKARAMDAGQRRLAEQESALAAASADHADLKAQLAALHETLRKERLHAAEKLQLLVDAKETMAKEFRLLAEDVMARHGERFGKQNKEQIDGLLQPMRDKLAEFQQGLQAAHVESARERATLGEQIRGLNEASAKMTTEATNLTRALKGQAQTQGAWGEMILESVLERSGLRKGEEYVTQASQTTEDGERLRPDVIVTLPGEQRRIVIDAKVSLVAFDGHVNAATDDERGACLRRHLDSMRAHIRTLGSKDYLGVAGSRLDFVVMFVPIESALAAALHEDPSLTKDAADNNVAIATPTTLMIALRTVASVWQVERRNKNAEKIADRAGKLYDKFAGFVADMHALGDRLGQADESYKAAMRKLSDGKGSLTRQVEQLKSMGANARKSLPGLLLGDDGEDSPPITEAVMVLTPAIAGDGPPPQG